MKFYNLHINCASEENHQKITKLLGVSPKDDNDMTTWWYQLCQDDEEVHINFSKVFESLLKPNMEKLGNLGITSNDMLIWVVYEYFRQCSLSFDSLELQRLGNLNIALNIDCYEAERVS